MEDKRLNITISFNNDKSAYEFAKNQPNSSYYIRKLVNEDIERNKKPLQDNFEIEELFPNIMSW